MTEEKSPKSTAARWGILLLVSAAALFIALLPFIVRGKYFIWTGGSPDIIPSDGANQHATFLEYMFGKNIFGGVGGYDYSIGLGGDYIVSFAYYMLFDPINLLLFILPRNNFALNYSFIIAIKFLITSCTMYAYLRAHKVKQDLSVVFSVAYMLGGFMLFTYTRHPDLTAGAMYLPLIILGAEKTIDKKQPVLLIASVFLLTISSFYMTFMVTLFAVAYSALYYVTGMKNRNVKITGKGFAAVFFRTAGAYILGLLLASFMLLPVAYGYMTAARQSGKGLTLYPALDIASIAASFISPAVGHRYTPVISNAITVMLALAAIATPKKSPYKPLSAVLAVGVFIPLVGFVTNMFNYANNRMCFMLSFAAFVLIAEHLNDEKDRAPDKSINLMIKGVITLCAVIVVSGAFALTEFMSIKEETAATVISVLLASGVTVITYFLLKKIYAANFYSIKTIRLFDRKKLMDWFVVLTLAFAVIYNGYYSNEHDNGTHYASLSSETESYVATLQEESDEFFRLDSDTTGSWRQAQNRPVNNGYIGTIIYNTMTPGVTGDFITSNDLVSFSTNLGMYGVNGRVALQALLGCKYYRAAETNYVPMQYSPVDGVRNLYVTDDYIRFGTVFENTMNVSVYNELSPVERQYAMLRAVVTDNGSKEYEYAPKVRDVTDDYQFEQSYTVRPNKTTEIPLHGLPHGEVYVQFDIKDTPSVATYFEVTCGDTRVQQSVLPTGDQMYTGRTEFLVKIDEHGKAINIKGLQGEAVTVTNMRILYIPTDTLVSMLHTAAGAPHLTETKFGQNGFSGNIDSAGGEMFIPLSFSDGWTAYIDGNKVEVSRANIGFMSVTVPSGTHTIKFEYKTPFYDEGIFVTACAVSVTIVVIGLSAYAAIREKKKRSEEKTDDI